MKKAIGTETGGHRAFRLKVVSPSVIQGQEATVATETDTAYPHEEVTDTNTWGLVATNNSSWLAFPCSPGTAT